MIAVDPGRGRRSTGWFRARLGIATTTVALLAAAAFAVSLAAGPPPAEAQGLTTGFSEDNMFLSPDASTRAYWFGRAAADKAQIARVNIYWRKAVGSARRRTRRIRPTPTTTSHGSTVPCATRAARHMQVLITVFGAPTWAEGKNRPSSAPLGTWKPDPHALGQFAQALAKRYSGSFQGLPRVSLFEVWNEPNLSVNLTPQWVGKKPTSPDLYRSLLNAFYRGVKSVAPADTVIGGATAPFGDPRSHPRDPKLPRMRPLAFLRQMFCLNNNLGPACNATTHLDVLSHHPINTVNPPTYRAINHDDIELADFHKLVPLIHAAERTGHVLPAGPHPLWATELAWYTKPPSKFGIPPAEQARWLEQGLYLLWKQGASVAVNFLLRDAPRTNLFSGSSGVFFSTARRSRPTRAFGSRSSPTGSRSPGVGAWGKAPESASSRSRGMPPAVG